MLLNYSQIHAVIKTHLFLIYQMTKREIFSRYKGSMLGILWSFIIPITMLLVYSIVFSVIFEAKWDIQTSSNGHDFSLILFIGLMIHAVLAETLSVSASLIIRNPNYVKKIVFPLIILPIPAILSVAFHFFISLTVFLIAFIALNGTLAWTTIFIVVVMFPFFVFILGLFWILSSLGVYLRDINQFMGVLSTVALFLSPVFYPASAVPEGIRSIILLNPLTFIIEQARNVLIFERLPDFVGLGIYLLIALLIAQFGYWWFQKSKIGFADVL